MSAYSEIIGRLKNKIDPDLLAALEDLSAGNSDRSQTVNALTATTATIASAVIQSLAATTLSGSATLGATVFPFQDITTDGAISSSITAVALDKAGGALNVTLAAPSAGRLLIITQYDAGTAGHTVTLTSGTWDGTNPVATFDAQGETLIVIGLSAARFLVLVNNGSVAFSGGS